MAKSKKFSGTALRLSISLDNGTTFKRFTDEMTLTLSDSTASIDTSSKDDGDFETSISSTKAFSIKCTAQLDLGSGGATIGYGDLLALIGAVPFKITTGLTGDLVIAGSARVENLEVKADHKSVATCDFTLKVVGAITTSTVA